MKKQRAELVFITTPAIGHFVSTIEFSKRLLNRSDRFSVTILVMKSAFEDSISANTSNHTQSLGAASHTHITLIQLPTVNSPPLELLHQSVEKYITVYIDSHKHHVRDVIATRFITNSVQLAGLVVDMFCTTMIDIANEFKVPSYLFFASGAGFLGFLLHLPARYDRVGKVFEESDPESIIPSYANPVPASALPAFALNKEGGYVSFSDHARRFKTTKGIIVNTFVELESHALGSLVEGDDQTPPVYTVGPLIDIKGELHVQPGQTQVDKIMKWLDDQPPKSVVFLCFGSFGSFDEPQLREIALGLEQSGQRFLWSVRQNPPKEKFEMPSDKNHEFLPQGFLERTRGLGILCGWAPQMEVLAHRAIGGFLSHCGWNSILESLWYGVPIATWPLYAEQQINAFQMVRDLGLAVEMRLDHRKGGGDSVMADEIERAVRCVMDGDAELRKRVQEMSEMSRRAVSDGGSSSTSFGSLIEVMLASLE